MANVDNELIKDILMPALENAIRYEHIQWFGETDGPSLEYKEKKIRQLQYAHSVLVRKVYKSEEMREREYLNTSIVEGADLGLHSALAKVVSNKELLIL